MKKTLLAAVVLTFSFHLSSFTPASAQTDPVLMEIGGEKVTQSQFMAEYESNVGGRLRAGATREERRKAIEEYVDLYAIFRAKMLDAHNMGLDTLPALRAEMAKYRAELAAPYLIDSSVLEGLLRQAYDRNHYSLCAAHILVRLAVDATPEDTVRALTRARELRQRVLNGEDFYAVAAEEVQRTNKDAKVRPNEGYLGYFSSFDMVYQFEDAAYSLEVGEVSQPVRTRFGYHIIKLLDRIPMHGKFDVAHIWIAARDSLSNRNRIDQIYYQIEQGMPFEMAARGSDDRTTRENGGLMPDATLNNLPAEYIDKLRTMKTGDITKPFFTQYGWHILKLVRADTLGSYENMVPYYKQRLVRDQRGEMSRKSFAATCRSRYGVVDYTKVAADRRGKKMKASLDELASRLPDSVHMGRWSGRIEPPLSDLRTLVAFADRQYNAADLASFIAKTQEFGTTGMDIKFYVNEMYDKFIDSVVIAYADSRLETEHPDFAALLEDYRRGLMIFDYNDKMIWTKAIKDTAGFADYYYRASATKRLDKSDDSVFFWHERARVVVLDITDSSYLTRAKTRKVLERALGKDAGSNGMKDALTKAMGRKAEGRAKVNVAVDLVEQGRQHLIGDDQWHKGVYIAPRGKGFRAIVVEEVIPRTLKTQAEARGYYLNEYQNEVERKLNESLLRKYNVKIDRNVVKALVR